MAEIELRHVEKKFGELHAVKPMDLTISHGEFVVLLGPSGCGKTTTLRMISGLETVTGGTIWLNGRNVTWRHPSERDIAFVFQFYALYPHLTVRQNIVFPLESQGESRDSIEKRVKEVVELLRIGHLLHLRPPSLSGGDQQRVGTATADPPTRDIRGFPHDRLPGGFPTVGDVFSDESNPWRKRPFDIRRVMLSVCDADHVPLERWAGWRDAEIAVTWDAHVGGYPVCMIGFESRTVPRFGVVPADGPEQWTSGTLFPMSSKKVARAINAASGNRPLVVLANLSGFDGSPESLRRWQLEYGAEIGRAVVYFRGPMVFCVVSRYHGGAFVVGPDTPASQYREVS